MRLSNEGDSKAAAMQKPNQEITALDVVADRLSVAEAKGKHNS